MKGKLDERNEIELNEWKRLRILGTWVLSPYMKERITAEELIPLPGDDANRAKEWDMNQERLEKEWERLENL